MNWKPIAVIKKLKEEDNIHIENQKKNNEYRQQQIKNKLSIAQENARLDAIMASLPTESKLGRINRLAKEAEERERLKNEGDKIEQKLNEYKSFNSRQKYIFLDSKSKKYITGIKKPNRLDPEIVKAIRENNMRIKKLQKKAEKKLEQDTADNIIINNKIDKPYTIEIDDYDDEDDETIQDTINIVKKWISENKTPSIFLNKEDNKPVKKIKTTIESSDVKGNKKIIKMGVKSFKDKTISSIIIEKRKKNKNRTLALEKLKDVKYTDVLKSNMCISVGNNKKCKYGNTCRFAHNIYELTPFPCFFGKNCKVIKTCRHIHPDETKIEYCKRVGII